MAIPYQTADKKTTGYYFCRKTDTMKKIMLLALCATLLTTACQKAKDLLTVKAFYNSNAFNEKNCDELSGLASTTGIDSVNVTFTNNSKRQLHINWINYSGAEEHWIDLEDGASHDIPTFKTHVWIVRKTDGACSTILIVRNGATNHETVSFGQQ
jgi:hypothetical protein